MKNPTIRVINHENGGPGLNNHLPGVWVEQLRRLGLLRVLREDTGDPLMAEVLEIECPWGPRRMDREAWCKMNAERMRSFGIDAVLAPKWGEEKDDRLPWGRR